MAKKNILVKDLIDAGILSQGNSLYSPFEDRILFPIRDILGRCCGFGGRVFVDGDERAKYYNSKESEFFSKGKLLFGLDLAKKEMQFQGKAFLVEGYTDVLAMSKAGNKNTVATLGTACTADHLKIISRYINTLYVLYDGDSAGQKAILRLTKLCWETNLDLQIVRLPNGLDPASFIAKNGKINDLIKNSSDIFTFFVGSMGEQFWGKSLSEKMNLCDGIIDVIAKIEDRLKQDLLLQQAAHAMQIPFESLKGILSKRDRRIENDSNKKETEKKSFSLEQKIIAMIINSSITDSKPICVDDFLISYFSKRSREVLEKIEKFSKTENRTFENLLDCFDDQSDKDWIIEQSFLVDYSNEDNDRLSDLFDGLIFQFRKKNWREIVRDMKERIFLAKQNSDEKQLDVLLHSFLNLKQEMKERGLI
jgi:DNA primase